MDAGMKLVFVYNADSGLVNALKDGIVSIVAPSKMPCRLCGLTFTSVSMRSKWKTFIDDLGVPVEFLHRNEFHERYGMHDAEFPAAYIDRSGELEPFISVGEMNSNKTLDALIEMVKQKTAALK